jgi:hypothetical protein
VVASSHLSIDPAMRRWIDASYLPRAGRGRRGAGSRRSRAGGSPGAFPDVALKLFAGENTGKLILAVP